MGCIRSQQMLSSIVRLPTVNGILKVTIINAKIQRQTSTFFQMDPYFKIKVSNQTALTKVIQKGGKQPMFNQTHSFFINSCYKVQGRFLELELWDQNKTSDSLIGFGIADLDPIINSKSPKTDLRVFLNYQLKPAGIVNINIEFQQQPFELVNFRFETASIRRKTSTLSNMNCFVQVTIGQEVLTTKKQKDTKQSPPVWLDDILTFNVPRVIKNCLIQIYDNSQIVGELIITTQELFKDSNEQNFDLQFDHKNVIAGTIKFQTIIGPNPEFSVIKRDYKRNLGDEMRLSVVRIEEKPSNIQKNPEEEQLAKKQISP